MPVATLAPYDFPSRDAVENYDGKQLLYVNWEEHRMFSRPFVIAVSPDLPFGKLVEDYISSYSYHPDYAQIVWDKVIWANGDDVFAPDFAKSLKDNGIGHKDLIRFTTPGLRGIAGTGF